MEWIRQQQLSRNQKTRFNTIIQFQVINADDQVKHHILNVIRDHITANPTLTFDVRAVNSVKFSHEWVHSPDMTIFATRTPFIPEVLVETFNLWLADIIQHALNLKEHVKVTYVISEPLENGLAQISSHSIERALDALTI